MKDIEYFHLFQSKNHRAARQLKKGDSYLGYLKESENINTKEGNFTELEEDLAMGKTDPELFNYSMHEFFNTLQQGKDRAECRRNIKNVLLAHCLRNPSIGYVQGINMLAAFLLCFLDEEGAFWLLTYIIEEILPKEFYSKTYKGIMLFGYYSECYAIKQSAIQCLELTSPSKIKSLHIFLDMILPSILLPLLVDTLNLECLYYVWDNMIKNKDVNIE